MEPFNCSNIINGFEFERYLSAWLNSVGFQANVAYDYIQRYWNY